MHLTRSANRVFDALLSIFYPQACAVCNAIVSFRSDGVACDACWQRTRIFTHGDTLCWKCGALSFGHTLTEQHEVVRCGRCDADSFTAARSCGFYEEALRASVLALKNEPLLCSRVVQLLRDVQSRPPLKGMTMIVPVPLHAERERQRGFNQAALIAAALSPVVQLPVVHAALLRSLHTERHRAGMDAQGRRATVAKAFKVEHPMLVQGERILLVDDVFTTGATASACANVLLEAGAVEVCVLTLARARH